MMKKSVPYTDADNAKVLYFAYGSNMSSRRLKARISSANVIARARLLAHQLRFHKHSLVDGSAKCDAYLTGQCDDVVWGVLYHFDENELTLLDQAEGEGYKRCLVQVVTDENHQLEAVIYVATCINGSLQPYDWYKRHVLEGATEHGLPQPYIANINMVPARTDPDLDRHQHELRIYL